MKNTFVTADHHFFHTNVIKLCNRCFKSQEEMHESMIDSWNSTVKSDRDTVYYLGDFSLANHVNTDSILDKLNGRIYFIRGNHDFRWFGRSAFGVGKLNFLPDIHLLRQEGHRFVLSHYPLASWDGMYRGYYHLHGHSHGNLKPKMEGRLDVGVDNLGYAPLSLERLLDGLKVEIDP